MIDKQQTTRFTKKKTLQKPLVAACTFTRLDEITPTVSDLLKKKNHQELCELCPKESKQ